MCVVKYNNFKAMLCTSSVGIPQMLSTIGSSGISLHSSPQYILIQLLLDQSRSQELPSIGPHCNQSPRNVEVKPTQQSFRDACRVCRTPGLAFGIQGPQKLVYDCHSPTYPPLLQPWSRRPDSSSAATQWSHGPL